MNRKIRLLIAVLVGIVVGIVIWRLTYVEERKEYHEPADRSGLKLTDDRLEDKTPEFDETLVDSRPLGDWQVNKSAAVIKLHCPPVKPDVEAELLVLRPSYAEAVKAAAAKGRALLPSANMLDGAAKQFDDGLYAALDLACYRGELGFAPAPPDFIEAVFEELPQGSAARPFLAAALELAGKEVDLKPGEVAEKRRFLREFERDKARSKPISFYNWTPELQRVWRFFRFLQREFSDPQEMEVPRAVAGVLERRPDLLRDYRAINAFYGSLTNPMICLPVDVLTGADETLEELAREHDARHAAVAVFPPATSRETELFESVFPAGLPAGMNLMSELIRRIRSGEVDLAPAEGDGWYHYQVYALETMLVPSRGEEKDKLLLTASYKRRLVEAFKALIVKRRETHVRQLGIAKGRSEAAVVLREGEVRPRLRIEPCATFYLRTARAYAFLQNFLLATVGAKRLAAMHGLKEGGERGPDLAAELDAVRRRFYGFYLVACEDIGMRPHFLDAEPVDREAAKRAALEWLENLADDPDLACDTRVAVPIYIDRVRGRTRLWATLGVRLTHLEASYARPPKVRPKEDGDEWQEVHSYQLGTSRYVIAVDEFAQFELRGSNALTRRELRALCDRHKTKDAVLRAINAM